MLWIRSHPYLTTLFFVCTANVVLWHLVWSGRDAGILTIAFLNIGQGDAIYIESPDHHQILVDSGPDDSVLGELRRVMPWYDRSIDMIMITNPDKDHIAGFISVFARYKVGQVIEPDTVNDTDVNRALHRSIELEGAHSTIARRGQVIDIGSGALLYILFPDRSLIDTDSNTGSIIAKLVYGNTSVILTGDAPSATLEYVAELDGELLHTNILKVGHHGSRTSASELFVETIKPEHAVISAGKKNKYGHPHKETTELFTKENVPVLGTYDRGTISMESDGEKFRLK